MDRTGPGTPARRLPLGMQTHPDGVTVDAGPVLTRTLAAVTVTVVTFAAVTAGPGRLLAVTALAASLVGAERALRLWLRRSGRTVLRADGVVRRCPISRPADGPHPDLVPVGPRTRLLVAGGLHGSTVVVYDHRRGDGHGDYTLLDQLAGVSSTWGAGRVLAILAETAESGCWPAGIPLELAVRSSSRSSRRALDRLAAAGITVVDHTRRR